LARENFFALVHPSDVQETRAELAVLVSGRAVRGLRNRARCRDGSYRWMQWNVTPASTQPDVVYGVGRDVSEDVAAAARVDETRAALQAANEELECEVRVRRWIEQELRQTERRFRAIFDSTFQFTGLLDATGTILESNASWLAFRGLAENDVLG